MDNFQSSLSDLTQQTIKLQKLIDSIERDVYSLFELNARNKVIESELHEFQATLNHLDNMSILLNSDEEVKLAKQKISLMKHVASELYLLWRRTLTISHKKIALHDQKNRDYLMIGKNEEMMINEKPKTLDAVSSDFTSGLYRTRQLLLQELEKSNESLRAFKKSSETLRSTLDEYSSQSSSMKLGHRILAKLKQRDFTDRLLLFTGLIFVCLVALSIIWSRLAQFVPFSLVSFGTKQINAASKDLFSSKSGFVPIESGPSKIESGYDYATASSISEQMQDFDHVGVLEQATIANVEHTHVVESPPDVFARKNDRDEL